MRSTSNKNAAGSAADRRRRKVWLVETFRADFDAYIYQGNVVGAVKRGEGVPACRCYRCGDLLTVDTVTADRIKPGCEGGTYRRDNLRPACGPCNSSTGGMLGAARRRAAS